jgi:S-formylglutathione hydrolase FrmB
MVSLILLASLSLGYASETPSHMSLQFNVTLAPGLVSAAQDGRLIVIMAKGQGREPRTNITRTGMDAPPRLGKDVKSLAPGGSVAVDRGSVIFPIASLDDLPAGDYTVQAVLMTNRDLKLGDAPGNLYSDAVKAHLDPKAGGTVELKLNHVVPGETMPAETDRNKFVKFQSELLSRFHGRPYFLRVGIRLPGDYATRPDRRYPVRVSIGGYGTRFARLPRGDEAADQMIVVRLDGAGPYGDPNGVNSENNGPYGDAITQELIPFIEKNYRGIGKPHARFLEGTSTGGWVSLALQVFYPDCFGGCWSCCPDPVDFHCFQLVNIYEDAQAFTDATGKDLAGERTRNGGVKETMRHQILIENVLGEGDSWTRSGQQWGSWNASFGPRGSDGHPVPLWDPKTGVINKKVLEHWKRYDLHEVLVKNWSTLGPKLAGKVRIWAGERDEFFLNNAVHRLDSFLKQTQPPFVGHIAFGPTGGHGWNEYTQRQINDQMLEEMRKKEAANP